MKKITKKFTEQILYRISDPPKNGVFVEKPEFWKNNFLEFFYYRYLDGECIDPFDWDMDRMPSQCQGIIKYVLAKENIMAACTRIPEISPATIATRDPLGNASFLACVTETYKCLKIVENFKWISQNGNEEWEDLDMESLKIN